MTEKVTFSAYHASFLFILFLTENNRKGNIFGTTCEFTSLIDSIIENDRS